MHLQIKLRKQKKPILNQMTEKKHAKDGND